MHYNCSECGRPVGLFVDIAGNPRQYRCPRTGRLAQPQLPIHRDTKAMTVVARLNVLRQGSDG